MRLLRFTALMVLGICIPATEAAIDGNVTFYARFEDTLAPVYAAGDWHATTRGTVEFTGGYIGRAVSVPDRGYVQYPAQDNILPGAGTVEMWVKWTEQAAAADKFNLLQEVSPSNNYVRFNRIAPDRLGMAFHAGEAENLQWQRVDYDPTGWGVGSWHHIAGTWDGGTIMLYVDGELVDETSQDNAMVDIAEEMTVGGPAVIDELRISNVARPAEEIKERAAMSPGPKQPIYLSDIERASSHQQMGMVGINHDSALDDRKLPLVIDHTAYGRGLSIHTPGSISFDLPEGLQQISYAAGISPFTPDGSARVAVSVDGSEVSTTELQAGDSAVEESLDIQGAGTLTIEATSTDSSRAGVIIANPVFLSAGSEAPAPFARTLTDADLRIQTMRTKCGDFSFDLPGDRDYTVHAGHPVDRVDPELPPLSPIAGDIILWAAPGEYEGGQLTLFTGVDMPSVKVSVDQLRSDDAILPAEAVEIRLVRRVLMRKGYWMNRDPDNYETVSRFLMPKSEFWLPEGTFKEIYVLVHVPDDVTPGIYTAPMRIEPEGIEPWEGQLQVRVLPINLQDPPGKSYGVYYRYANMIGRPEVLEAELEDISAHGGTMLHPGVGIRFIKQDDGTITWTLEDVRHLLDHLRAHGFSGTIPVNDRIRQLGRIMDYEILDEEGGGEPIAEKEDLLAIVRDALADLKELDEDYPEFTLALAHMDEVFGRGRLPAFMDAARVVRKTSDFPIYITIHMMPGRWEDYMEESDPLIDIRCINGHSLEEWLAADGNDWEEMAEMLEASGDRAWLYHNMRGSFFRAEWNRIINGFMMWESPLQVHVPWMYYSYGGNPLDDTDNEHFDFGYAFPHPDDPTQMVSTLHWEAYREGYDDLRYFATLEQTIEQAREAGVDVSDAVQWLEEVHSMLPDTPEDIEDIELESPYSVKISEQFSGADYDRIRHRTAEHIMRLDREMNR